MDSQSWEMIKDIARIIWGDVWDKHLTYSKDSPKDFGESISAIIKRIEEIGPHDDRILEVCVLLRGCGTVNATKWIFREFDLVTALKFACTLRSEIRSMDERYVFRVSTGASGPFWAQVFVHEDKFISVYDFEYGNKDLNNSSECMALVYCVTRLIMLMREANEWTFQEKNTANATS